MRNLGSSPREQFFGKRFALSVATAPWMIGDMRGKKVLIIEEDLIVAEDLKEIFEAHGYRVEGIVSSESVAIEKIVRTAPDIILLDLSRDRFDGHESSRLLNTLVTKRTDVILVDGFLSKDFSEIGEQRAVVIKKPFSNDAIVNALGRLENEMYDI